MPLGVRRLSGGIWIWVLLLGPGATELPSAGSTAGRIDGRGPSALGESWKAFLILDLGHQFTNFQPCILLDSSLDAHRGVGSRARLGLPPPPQGCLRLRPNGNRYPDDRIEILMRTPIHRSEGSRGAKFACLVIAVLCAPSQSAGAQGAGQARLTQAQRVHSFESNAGLANPRANFFTRAFSDSKEVASSQGRAVFATWLQSISSNAVPARLRALFARGKQALEPTSAAGSDSGATTSSQLVGSSLVERGAALGLIHRHAPGLDVVGDDTVMLDWLQSGVALGDLDGDADFDVVAAGGLEPNHVFEYKAPQFVDRSSIARINAGELDRVPALGDYDGDGDLDLFMGAASGGNGAVPGHNRLYRNEYGYRFTDVSALARVEGRGHTIHARWADLDQDGLLDLYLGEFHGTPNIVYRNCGGGSFEDVTPKWGLGIGGSTHVVGTVDLDRDGYLDVFVGNDFNVSLSMGLNSLAADIAMQGQPGASFKNVSITTEFWQTETTMGLAFGDVNYDGQLDVFKTEYGRNFLLLNLGFPIGYPSNGFQQAAADYGLSDDFVPGQTGDGAYEVSWGTSFIDLDLDRWLDLIVINGHVADNDPRQQPNDIFLGSGPSQGFEFLDRADLWGDVRDFDDRGMAVADMDADGDVDIFVTPVQGRLRFYENRLDRADRSSITITPKSTTSAPGGVIVEWTDSAGFVHIRPVGNDAPTASQNAEQLVLGLGQEPSADLLVSYPSGIELELAAVPAGSALTPVEPKLVELLPSERILGSAGSGPLKVIAYAHDQAGQPLVGATAADIGIEVTGLQPRGPVEALGGNQFSRSFAAPQQSGEYPVLLNFDGFEPRTHRRFDVVGAFAPSRLSMNMNPECLQAGSGQTTRVQVVPRDDRGRPLGAGLDLELKSELGLYGPLTDLGDGRYAGQLRATKNPGSVPILLRVNGMPVDTQQELEIAGLATDKTTVELELPHALIASRPHEAKLLVTPRDAAGRRLGPGALVELIVVPDPGSEPTECLGDRRKIQADGDFTFVLARAKGSALKSAHGDLLVVVDGLVSLTTRYEF